MKNAAAGLVLLVSGTAVGLISGLILQLVDPRYTWHLILLLAVLFVSLTISAFVTFRYASREIFLENEQLVEIQSKLESAKRQAFDLLHLLSPHPFIIMGEALKDIEESAKEVWVATPDFFWDYDNEEWKRHIKGNIESGARYIYFFPDTQNLRAKALDLQRDVKGRDVHFFPVPEANFSLLQHETVIYDPLSKQPHGVMGDLQYMRYKKPEEAFDIRLDRQVISNFIEVFKKWLDLYKDKEL